MLTTITIVLLVAAFLFSIYYQNTLYLKNIAWEKREKIANAIMLAPPTFLALASYLLSKKTEAFFDRPWIDLCILYYVIGFIIKLAFFAWGKWRMNKYHEAKRRAVQP